MPDLKKQEYYRKNREARLTYQREYYHRTKPLLERKDEIMAELEPEKLEKRKRKKSRYNRAYYLRNKSRIMERRKEAHRKLWNAEFDRQTKRT
jgi:hypothetical protein